MKVLIMGCPLELTATIAAQLAVINLEYDIVQEYQEMLRKLQKGNYSCLVLNSEVAKGKVFQWIDEFRQINRKTGLIVLASEQETLKDKLEVLYRGADDFLSKPFDTSELVARIFSIQRRSGLLDHNVAQQNELRIDLNAKLVFINDKVVKLTRREFELLVFFMDNKNKVITKELLIESLFGKSNQFDSSSDIIYAHIKNLKKKISQAGCKIYLKTIYGVGYKWEN